MPAESFIAALERVDVALQLFDYCAENLGGKPGIADVMAKNPSCPATTVRKVAGFLTTTGIQALLDNLERLTASVPLIDALASSAEANAEQRGLLQELLGGALGESHYEDAVSAIPMDQGKRQTLIQRLSKMNVVQRVQLALLGGREERIALIRDPNKVVQRSVLQSPRLTESEVESFAAMTTLTQEILRIISNNRLWMKNYTIVRNLASNSKTPLDISLRLLPRINPRDLKILSASKNIPETLRAMAAKMGNARNEARKE
ncbi:MAG TPA: hypothetical protein VGR81_13950 [Candidatus Acidoferrales bacterium]|nr:hypothetical protein [Candidatus Acidoferrales bacterium]